VEIAEPESSMGGLKQVDMRVGKNFRFGRRRRADSTLHVNVNRLLRSTTRLPLAGDIVCSARLREFGCSSIFWSQGSQGLGF